jgi:hypothetical protein
MTLATATRSQRLHVGGLSATARTLAALLRRAHFAELADAAAIDADRVDAGVCTLAVVGEFKRGKSTLINALIGADLLPVGALPVTTVGTCVELADSLNVIVDFLDGRQIRISPESIAEYVTERGNPGNECRPNAPLGGALRGDASGRAGCRHQRLERRRARHASGRHRGAHGALAGARRWNPGTHHRGDCTAHPAEDRCSPSGGGAARAPAGQTVASAGWARTIAGLPARPSLVARHASSIA